MTALLWHHLVTEAILSWLGSVGLGLRFNFYYFMTIVSITSQLQLHVLLCFGSTDSLMLAKQAT